MDSNSFIDEDTIYQRILYKEKADLKSFALKCLDLEKSDYSKISPPQRDEILESLLEDLSSLEDFTEKQSLLHTLYFSEKQMHLQKQAQLKVDIEIYSQDIQQSKAQLDYEKNKRVDLLEYEAYAKQINTLPRCEVINQRINEDSAKLQLLESTITNKENKLRDLEEKSRDILRQVRETIKETEDLSMTSLN